MCWRTIWHHCSSWPWKKRSKFSIPLRHLVLLASCGVILQSLLWVFSSMLVLFWLSVVTMGKHIVMGMSVGSTDPSPFPFLLSVKDWRHWGWIDEMKTCRFQHNREASSHCCIVGCDVMCQEAYQDNLATESVLHSWKQVCTNVWHLDREQFGWLESGSLGLD